MKRENKWYAGVECRYVYETNDNHFAQDMLDAHRAKGLKAFCTHYNDMHQVYVEIKVQI